MEPRISGFGYQRVTVADSVLLNVAAGGSGSPIVLLHGFPQTHLMWRHWGAVLGFDAAALWGAWASHLEHIPVSFGHFMAEEAPADVVKALRDLLAR